MLIKTQTSTTLMIFFVVTQETRGSDRTQNNMMKHALKCWFNVQNRRKLQGKRPKIIGKICVNCYAMHNYL